MTALRELLEMTKTPSSRRRADMFSPSSRSGWTITPKTIGTVAACLVLAAAAWKPIEVFSKLSNSIDNLSTAVGQLQGVMKEQGQDIVVIKGKIAGFEQLKEVRSAQLSAIEARLSTMEARRP